MMTETTTPPTTPTTPPPPPPPTHTTTPSISNKLVPRNYQVAGINWLCELNVPYSSTDPTLTYARHLLTDAPGSGKTFQASEAAIKLSDITMAQNPTRYIHGYRYCTAVICPAHLVKQWYDFLVAQYPHLHIVSINGSDQKTKWTDLKLTGIDFLIISVQSLRKKPFLDACIQAFTRNHVLTTIIDESHYIKNNTSLQSENVRYLTRPDFCSNVILLTATPIVREADDLYSQFRTINPYKPEFHSQARFLSTYCYATYSSWGPSNVTLRKGSITYLAPYMMGRNYHEIGLELPPIIPPLNSPSAIVATPLPSSIRKIYDDMKTFWAHAMVNPDGTQTPVLTADNAMKVMHLLRALTNCTEKRQSLITYLADDPGPYLIGCFYRRSVSTLCADLRQAGYNPIEITGDVPADIRPTVAKSAHNPKDVVVATMPSISEGVDLSHLNTVYFYEEDFTPGKMYQFMSRVRRHREPTITLDTTTTTTNKPTLDNPFADQSLHITDPNQTPVICRYFHALKTIDERIHAVQSNRAVSIKDIIKVELLS